MREAVRDNSVSDGGENLSFRLAVMYNILTDMIMSGPKPRRVHRGIHSEAIMSNTDIAFTQDPVSVSDGGYQQARAHGTARNIVRALMRFIPGLGSVDNAITDEVRDELRKGYALRWHEENPTRYFVAADGNWVECKTEEEMMSHKKAEKFTLDVHTAFAYTQQAFGALKNEEPKKHGLLKIVRDKFNKYVSNRIGDLNRDAKRIYKEDNGIKTERSPTAAFIDWLNAPEKGALSVIRQRCINAKAKGDETADVAKLDKALAAFKGAMSK